MAGGRGGGGGRCSNSLLTLAVQSSHHIYKFAQSGCAQVEAQGKLPQEGSVGRACGGLLTWNGKSTVPLPIWFTLGRDPP